MDTEGLLHMMRIAINGGSGGISEDKRVAYAEGFLDCMRYAGLIDTRMWGDTLREVCGIKFTGSTEIE